MTGREYEWHINGLKSIKPFMQSYLRAVDYEGLGELDAIEVAKTIDIAVDALDKRIPKKPIKDKRYTKELCPVCNDFVRLYAGTPMNFCCNCGQSLDWGDVECE